MQRNAGAAITRRGCGSIVRTREFSLVGVLVMGLAVTAGASADDNLRRCEDASGHITYSNEACPEGTSRERKVEARPAVEIPRDAAAAKVIPNSKAGTGGIMASGNPPGRPRDPAPEADSETLQEKRKALVARCDDLVRRIEYGQQDLLTAAAGERASVELGVRRLQEEHESLCAPPKPQ